CSASSVTLIVCSDRLGILLFFLPPYDDHRDLHSFPTRRSSDLIRGFSNINATLRLAFARHLRQILHPLKPHAPTAKRKLFAAIPTLIHFVHIYIEKK